MNTNKVKEFLNTDVLEIAQEVLAAFEKNPVTVDDFVQQMTSKIEADKSKLLSNPNGTFLGGEIEVSRLNDRFFNVKISYYIQNNDGEIKELSKPIMQLKKHLLIEKEFMQLAENSIKYPIS